MSDNNHAERFAVLFRGFTKRYGSYTLTGQLREDGKKEGEAKTVDQTLKASDYTAHVKGTRDIGVVPLCDDNTVHFAAIDLDVYPGSEKNKVHRNDGETDHDYKARVAKEHRDWADEICIDIRHEPLFASWSKSGGLHLWLFSKEGIPAHVAIDYLKNVAHRIGYAGCEIFPKQSKRHSDQDVGNWINLPFFGEERLSRMVRETDTGFDVEDIGIGEFLDIAEDVSAELTANDLEKVNIEATKEIGAPTEKWYDGPPCLQRLTIGDPRRVQQLRQRHEKKKRDGGYDSEAAESRQENWIKKQERNLTPELTGGARNTVFFNVALYLARRELLVSEGKPTKKQLEELEDHLMQAHEDWAVATEQKRLSRTELQTLAAQGNKANWHYQCKQSPLKDFCDSKKCRSRPFAVGSRTDDIETPIEGFTIVTSKPPVFYFDIAGERVSVTAEELLNQKMFALSLMNNALVTWPFVNARVFSDMVDQLIKSAARVEPLPEQDLRDDIAGILYSYLNRHKLFRGQGHDMKFMQSGKPLHSKDGKSALFKMQPFFENCRIRMGITLTKQQLIHIVTNELGARRAQVTLEGQQSAVGYEIDFAVLEARL